MELNLKETSPREAVCSVTPERLPRCAGTVPPFRLNIMDNTFILSDLGVVSALGSGLSATAQALAAGDASGLVRLEGTLPAGDVTRFGFARGVPGLDGAANTTGKPRVAALLDAALAQLAPALEALRETVPPERLGVVLGTSNSTMEEFTANPDTIDMAFPAEYVAEAIGAKGPAWAVSTACSSSGKVFASARRLLQDGLCDAVVVGGADAFTRVVVNGFNALEAVSPDLTRPLAADRDGINLGEGAALFVLRRGTSGVALAGVGESSDAYHLTAPDPEGRGAERALRAALSAAGMRPEEVDYLNLHGTGTTYNDAMECAAVARVFGARICCSSTKPLTGHALGAAGAIEAALCWLALRGLAPVPPHVTEPVDTALAPFDLPRRGDRRTIRTALSSSFAFGGSNAAVLLRRI